MKTEGGNYQNSTTNIKNKFTPNRVKIQRIIIFLPKKVVFLQKMYFLKKNYPL